MFQSVLLPVWPLAPFDQRWDAPRRGLWGERAVARYLWLRGYSILNHRWQAESGSDIDLIASDSQRLLFAEVKLRSPDDPDPLAQAFDQQRLERLRAAIGEYVRRTGQTVVALTVEAFLVTPDPANPRRPVVRREPGILNPTTIPGWQGSNQLLERPG